MGGENEHRQGNDANLCGDMRALVTVLREIRDEQRRCADALEKVAEGVNPPDHESVAQSALYCYRVMSDLYEKVGR